LLDKNRNIIVTDFGFANQFSSAADDLMATTCGSPCYAAPELVVNAGLYAGSAVDIWSCGVILYAMLCGFLPFDDDPANPDSDNINQLYRYILSTNLVFPTHVSSNARDLLDKMLVPDPAKRCSLDFVIKHPWLESHRTFLKKDTAQIEKEESVAQRLSVKPGIKNKSNLIINSSVSTSQPRKVTAPGVSTARKTHIPVVSRDRFAPISNEKYLETNSKLSNTITEKPVIADSSTKTGPFRRFSIGRSSAITNTSEKQIHATNVAPTTIDRSPDITRKPVKQEEEGHYTSNHSSIAVASHLTAANTDDNVQNIHPEKSLSSPTSTSDTKRSGISTLGSIRRGQRLGTDKFLSFFTNGRSSHTPTVTKKQEDMPSIFDEGKHKNDALYVHTEVNNNVHEATEHAAQDSAISCSNDTTETEERLPVNHNKHHHAILHSSSEASTIGGSTPSLCPSSPLNSVADPLTPLSPTFSLGQHHQPNFKAETNGASIRSIVNTQEESSRQPNSNQNFHSTSSVIHEDEESEVYEPSFSQEQCSQARDRGNSISTTSVLSEHQGSMNSNSVSFKEAPRHASPLITRQRNSHKHHQTDKDSSIRSASIDEDRDNSSVSSHGAYPLQLEVSNSTRLMTKAVENGGRHVIAAVRRSIYRKHKSQPPPQHHTEENNHVTTTSTTTKEPITSFAKSRFEETDAAPKSSHRDRSTWSASTRTTSGGVQLPTNKKKVDSSTTTNNQSLAPKRTGNKMMDWIKKKSHGK
jgi:hypothetical protein